MRIIGHRGARGEAPENTLGGFQYIQDLGIRAVEFDVRQLKDDALIIMHDDQMIRTTGQEKSLYDCTSSDLCNYDQSHTWQSWENFEVTPLLDHTLKIIHNFDHIEVEVKAVSSDYAANKLVETLQRHLTGYEHSAVITSFDTKIHQALNQQKSSLKHGLLIENDIQHRAIDQALTLGCCQIGWMNQLATNEIIASTQAANLAISVWTVNDIKRAQELLLLGVDGLITDFPKEMQKALSSKT